MDSFKALFQSADWKTEKHSPVIEAQDKVKKGTPVSVRVSVGKQISHPNTTAHHIRWIGVYFKPDGSKFVYQIGRYEFSAHGASVEGADTSTVYSRPEVETVFTTEKSGVVYASSYCNIHGLWESSKPIRVE